mmetsp:Transcript_39760/g.71370  ORF Transcript_39760/g.71370 Transcript_39760/m.71370 type:complete len:956 (-) Transcript_39760:110-2977(-)
MEPAAQSGGEPAPLTADMRMSSFENFWDAVPDEQSPVASLHQGLLQPQQQPQSALQGSPNKLLSQATAGTSTRSVDSTGSKGELDSGDSGECDHSSQYRGVSYDKKKQRWRVQIKVASLGRSGVSVGYFDTEVGAARAYDKTAIGLLGREGVYTNFPMSDYNDVEIQPLNGLSRDEVKVFLKTERTRTPRTMAQNKRRTSKFLGVGSSFRKNQWQARILIKGKVTHLGYYGTEEEAARIYDRVCLSLHGPNSGLNFPADEYKHLPAVDYTSLSREDLQRSLGVKPMDKSSQYRGVSRKKGKWEAKVMLNRKWAYRELFDNELDAARAYDKAVWRLKPGEAKAYVNFKEEVPDAEHAGGGAAATQSGGKNEGKEALVDLVEATTSKPPATVTTNYRFVKKETQASPRAVVKSPAPPFASPPSQRIQRSTVTQPDVLEAERISLNSMHAAPQEEPDARPPVDLNRDKSLGMDWLASLANVRDGNFSANDDRFNQAASDAIQEMGYQLEQGQQQQQQPSSMSAPLTSQRPNLLSLQETVAAGSESTTGVMCRHGSINSQIIMDLGTGLTTSCRLSLPRPSPLSTTPSFSKLPCEGASSPRVIVSSTPTATCHVDFPDDSVEELPCGGHTAAFTGGMGAVGHSMRSASGLVTTNHGEGDGESMLLLRDLIQQSKSASSGQASRRPPLRRSQSMEQRDMQLRAALSRGGMLLRAPRPTVTTGMQDSGALRAAVRATGQIFSEEEETILSSKSSVRSQLARCNSLVAQEMLVTRSLSANSRPPRANSPFASAAYQGTDMLHGLSSLGPRGAASAPGGPGQRSASFSLAQSQQTMHRTMSNPRLKVNQGIVGLLSRMGSHSSAQRLLPRSEEALQRGWSVVSGVPILMQSLSVECGLLSSTNSDAVRETSAGEEEAEEVEEEEAGAMMGVGYPFALGDDDMPAPLRCFASHDGTYDPPHSQR